MQNAEDFQKWLEGKPGDVAVALAVRSALRVLPILLRARDAGLRGDFRAALVVPVFRAAGVAWYAAKYLDQATRLQGAAFAAYSAAARAAAAAAARAPTAATAATAAAFAARAADAAYSAADAAYSAADAARAAADDARAADARAADADARAAARAAVWSALSADATRIEEGASPSQIASSLLWPGGQPRRIDELWQAMKRGPLAADEGWDVWTDWYEARLNGQPAIEELEIARATIPDEIWDQGPATVNAHIEDLIEQHKRWPASPPDPPPQPKKFVGFFSYAHADAMVDPNLVEAFSSELEKRVDAKIVNGTFEIWRDDKKLKLGDYWDENIQNALRAADVMVVLFTPKWISSDYCRKEFALFKQQEQARDNGSFVAPIYVRNIENQLHDLVAEQRTIYDDVMARQYKKISPAEFVRLSDPQKTALIEGLADDLVAILKRRKTSDSGPPPSKPEIPPQRPASVAPVVSKGKVTLPRGPARTDGDSSSLLSALMALRAEIVSLADAVEAEPSNIDKRVVPYLRETADLIPDHIPAQAEFFQLAHRQPAFEKRAAAATTEWPDLLAERFQGVTEFFNVIVQKSPDWRNFVRRPPEDEVTPGQAVAAKNVEPRVIEELRDPDASAFVDPSIPDVLEKLQAPLQREGVPSESIDALLVQDVIDSTNNTLIRIAEVALGPEVPTNATPQAAPTDEKKARGLRGAIEKIVSSYTRAAEKSLIDEAEQAGRETGPAARRWLKRFIYGGGALALIQLSPTAFRWLEALKPFLGLH